MTLLLAFVACEKCDKPISAEDPFVNATDRSAQREDFILTDRAGDQASAPVVNDGTITDPNEDEDFDGIVDPDEDEDFDKDGK